MKEIPILFSTPMVQAILDDRKTMTRRIVKPQPIWNIEQDGNLYEGNHNGCVKVGGHPDWAHQFAHEFSKWKGDDILWVRESWQLKAWNFEDGMMTVKYSTGETLNCDAHDPNENSEWLINKIDQLYKKGLIKPDPANREMFIFTEKKQPFLPSIHMPKEAARIWLQVTDVRVERLQDITEEDAKAEGVQPNCEGIEKCPSPYCQRMGCQSTGEYYHYLRDLDDFPAFSAKESFESLWQSINGAESWEANPWVWVINFKVLSATGKPDLQILKAIA